LPDWRDGDETSFGENQKSHDQKKKDDLEELLARWANDLVFEL